MGFAKGDFSWRNTPNAIKRWDRIHIYLKESLKNLRASTLENYFLANAQEKTLEKVYGTLPEFLLISTQNLEAIFENYATGWDNFREKFSQYEGCVDISAPGFSKKHTQALIYLGKWWDELGGIGKFFLYQLKDKKWLLDDVALAWMA